MTEVSSQLPPDLKTEETLRNIAENELGSLAQEEVDLDAQIEAQKILIEQKGVSGQNVDGDANLLEILEEKRGRVTVALELSAQKHGYELSTEMGDNTRNVLIDGILKKQKKEQGVPVVSNMERDTISHMMTEKPSTTEKLREMTQATKEEPGEVLEANLSTLRLQLKDLQENMGKGNFSPEKDGGKEGDEILTRSLEEQIKTLGVRLGEKTSDIQSRHDSSPEQTSVGGSNPVVYESPERKPLDETSSVAYQTPEGVVIPTRTPKPQQQEEISLATPEVPSHNVPESLFQDATLTRIHEEIIAVRKEFKEKMAQIRDHAIDTNSNEVKRWKDKQTSNLNTERTEYIRNKIQTMPIKEVVLMRATAVEKMKDTQEERGTEAMEVMRWADERIKEREAGGSTQQTPENPPVVSETTTPDSNTIEYAPQINASGAGIATEEALTPDSAAHIKATGEVVPSPFENAIAKIKSEDPARAERLLATIGTSPEKKERIEKLLEATQIQKEKIETEAKEKRVLDILRGVGERYQKIPLKWRVGVGLALMGGAYMTGAGILGSAIALGLTVRRGMAGIGTFMFVEGVGRKWVDRSKLSENNKERGRKFATATGVIAGVLMGGGAKTVMESYESLTGIVAKSFHGDGMKTLREYYESFRGGAPSVPVPPQEIPVLNKEDAQEIYASAKEQIHQSIPLPHEAVGETAHSIMTPGNELVGHATDRALGASYHVGSSGRKELWNIIKEKIPEIQDLDGEGRQSNAIANIIAKIRLDPGSYGISSGDVDKLVAGDTLNLDKIHDILKTTTIPIEDGQSVGIIERASGLTDVEASHIMNNNAKISAWHTAHPDTLLTTETVEKILNGTIDATVQTDSFAKDFILSMPDTGGRTIEQLSAEALVMDTDAVLHADVQTMFGSKGLFDFGFLGTNGERSVDWLDFKGRTVSEIMSKKFEGVPLGDEGAVQKFGIDSYGAVDKLKGYLKMLIEKAGTSPESNESVEHFS